jgi:hypothetical protein
MNLSWRISVGITIGLLVLGGIAIAFLLDPNLFSFSTSAPGQTLVSGNEPPQVATNRSSGGTQVGHDITSTATGVYCNCTDTYSQG